jgi:hypothetical protein
MLAQGYFLEYADTGKQRKDFRRPNFYTAASISALALRAFAVRCKMGESVVRHARCRSPSP